MTRGYMFTPIVFIALFLIAASFSFYVSQADRALAKSINREAEIKKTLLDAERDLLKASEVAYETLYTSPTVNNRTLMEAAISTALKGNLSLDANVTISGAGGKLTLITLNITDYVRKRNFTDHTNGSYDVLVNLSGYSFKTVVGIPSHNLSLFYENYNASEVCPYYNESAADGTCWINQTYGSAKAAATGFYFYAQIVSQCVNKQFTFKVNITDPENIATYGRAFNLDNRTAQGTYNFTVGC